MDALLVIPIIVLLYGGGFAIALIALLIATFRKSRSSRIWLSAVAALALLAQGGCWKIASDIGNATSGAGGSIVGLMILVGAAALVWSVILIASARNPKPRNENGA